MRKHVRKLIALAAVVTAVPFLAGCSDGGGAVAAKTAPTTLSGTVSLWSYWTDREAGLVQSVVHDFEKAHPGVQVQMHNAQDGAKIAQVIASGGTVDVAWLSTPQQLGTLCPSGGFQNLQSFIKRDGVALSAFSAVAQSATKFKGTQCSMPSLADAYGLYYNTPLLQKAGYSAPPKTLDQLESMALKLTTYNSDGSIKTLGFNPMMGFYENKPEAYAPLAGANWMSNGKSALAAQAGWKELMTWQKGFVDKIGYAKLKKFTAGVADEFSADNAFQRGQVAMAMDGEWRVAFIRDQAPGLKYGTAPFPTPADHTDLYGGGYSTLNVLGMAKTSKNPELAWALMRYLSTDTSALSKLENGLANIPPTNAATSASTTLPSQFKTFLTITQDPHVGTPPNTTIGSGQQDNFMTAWVRYQSGSGGDPISALKEADEATNNALALNTGP